MRKYNYTIIRQIISKYNYEIVFLTEKKHEEMIKKLLKNIKIREAVCTEIDKFYARR